MRILSTFVPLVSIHAANKPLSLGTHRSDCALDATMRAELYTNGVLFQCTSDKIMRVLQADFGKEHTCENIPAWCALFESSDLENMQIVESDHSVLDVDIVSTIPSSGNLSKFEFVCHEGPRFMAIRYVSSVNAPDVSLVQRLCVEFLGGVVGSVNLVAPAISSEAHNTTEVPEVVKQVRRDLPPAVASREYTVDANASSSVENTNDDETLNVVVESNKPSEVPVQDAPIDAATEVPTVEPTTAPIVARVSHVHHHHRHEHRHVTRSRHSSRHPMSLHQCARRCHKCYRVEVYANVRVCVQRTKRSIL